MASENSFSHIAVNSGDDDVVIHAGATELPEEPEVFEEEQEEVVEAEPEPVPVTAPKAKDAYHETTLADIEGSKMSTTQRVVVVLAILAVIAIAVWMIFFNS
ncbi:MAG: hypothetical protein HFJ66_02780 [Eggerthellaceae bacterium]|nr:hypothetical protein [Eggerthellaceae bacterium]